MSLQDIGFLLKKIRMDTDMGSANRESRLVSQCFTLCLPPQKAVEIGKCVIGSSVFSVVLIMK